VEFPARFMLVAASNPCPCGFDGDPRRACRCPPNRMETYRHRLSGPLLDRIDIHLVVPRLSQAELLGSLPGEPSTVLRQRVEAARRAQVARLAGSPWACNAQMPGGFARRKAGLTAEGMTKLAEAVERLALSGRGFDRMIKLARTIADLEGSMTVDGPHVGEALNFRALPEPREVAPMG
jgi:magnesium chelatase family protein